VCHKHPEEVISVSKKDATVREPNPYSINYSQLFYLKSFDARVPAEVSNLEGYKLLRSHLRVRCAVRTLQM